MGGVLQVTWHTPPQEHWAEPEEVASTKSWVVAAGCNVLAAAALTWEGEPPHTPQFLLVLRSSLTRHSEPCMGPEAVLAVSRTAISD